jgi:ADP-ribosylglycohydrolase
LISSLEVLSQIGTEIRFSMGYLGDDADTTGAICGQLAGAYWRESGISESLRAGLARMDMIENALAGILKG